MNVSHVPPWDKEHAWVPLPVAGGFRLDNCAAGKYSVTSIASTESTCVPCVAGKKLITLLKIGSKLVTLNFVPHFTTVINE